MIQSDLTENSFIWNGISILQEQRVFKIGTDALLLGAWVPKVVVNPDRILDAGTGTGILSMMMAYYFENALIMGVDQEKAAVDLATSNFNNSLWSGRLTAHQENILEDSASTENKFDLLICNPPFFYRQLEAKIEVKAKAKHADASSRVWMKALAGKLCPSGNICIVVPFDKAYEWITSANEMGLYCHHRLDIYSFRTDRIPGRSLLHFNEKLVLPEAGRLDIYDDINRYTQSYLDFTKINSDRIKKSGQKH